MLLSQISGRIVSDIQEAQGMRFDEILRASLTMPTIMGIPFLHMPRDEYGTLSINVEEEVNIPSGVTIGNVMLPSVKETFEQIWPDAVKKALEILFKQNRTEKMSMAQYQIYVSKLWSEICQKVGYMNIVDYDNFGDIKSIFYDLEKKTFNKKRRMTGLNEIENVYGETVEFYDLSALSQIGNKKNCFKQIC